jgi:hypothetical protein
MHRLVLVVYVPAEMLLNLLSPQCDQQILQGNDTVFKNVFQTCKNLSQELWHREVGHATLPPHAISRTCSR